MRWHNLRVAADGILHGRDGERTLLHAAVDGVGRGGVSILVSGDPGLGKTALVDDAVSYAMARGFQVLRTAGTTAESGEQYAALHLLLHPLRGTFDLLPGPQQDALAVVFGLADGKHPSPLMTGLAALTALSDAATRQPLLVVVEDLHWIDSASAWALQMIGRRIGQDPIVMISTTRDTAIVDDDPSVQKVRLVPLRDIDANALLDALPQPPQGTARRTLLELSEGNPLALIELGSMPPVTAESFLRPVVGRLERTFAGRFAELEQPTRLAILAIAIGDIPHAEEAARLANHAVGRHPVPSWTDDAAAASLIEWAPRSKIRFRHPLVRSAVIGTSLPAERAAVLRALIDEYADDSGRTVWWRAELAVGDDGLLADELDRIAGAAYETGDILQAWRAMARAAEMTADPQRRVDRLISAAEYAGMTGRGADASLLIHQALASTDDPLLAARAAWVSELLPTGHTGLSHGDIGPALAAIDAMRRNGAVTAAADALMHLAAIAWDHTTDAIPGAPLLLAVEGLGLNATDPRSILLAAVTDPIARGGEVIARAEHIRINDTTPESAWWIGYALNLSGEIETAHAYLERAVEGLSARGDLRLLPHALMGTSMTNFLHGDFSRARTLAEEALTLGADIGDAGYLTAVRCGLAWFAAIDGEAPDFDWITGGDPVGAQTMHASAMRATFAGSVAAAALLDGRPQDTVTSLADMLSPGDASYAPAFAVITSPDYIDAALLLGDRQRVQERGAQLAELLDTWRAPMVESATRYARLALTAEAALTTAAHELETAPLAVPFMHARALLRLGDRLRRNRQPQDSRHVLHEALDLFRRLPAPAWASRTAEALRAAGEKLPDYVPSGAHVLTPQELRICTLAADGLTNREIAEHLFLSPRTVGAHLYSAYQKLGITSRDQLAYLHTPRSPTPDSRHPPGAGR
jgi:DNA-binding CsgD family transcriptional regulator